MTGKAELLGVISAWDRAMISNDPVEIGRYMSDDWTIIGPDGSVNGKAGFLAHVASGALTHDVMETHDARIRFYGDAAVVIGRGVSGGAFNGARFHLVERVSCVFARAEGRWVCVSTHLSLLDAG
jgi:ketosteroid isomerase-like protein